MLNTLQNGCRGLTIECLPSLDVDTSLERQWGVLAGNNPFLSWQWLECWWRHYRSDRRDLCVLAIRDSSEELVGIAPWYLERSFVQGRVLRFLGSGEVCSDYLTILCKPPYQETAAAAVARWLTDSWGYRWELLDLDGAVAADPALAILAENLGSYGCAVNSRPAESCWRIELPDTWEHYLRTLSKSRREKIRQLHRRFLDSGVAKRHFVTTENEWYKAFSVLCDLHQARRNSLGQPGCFVSPRFTAFHRETGLRMLRDGQLRMQWITLEGSPIAVEYGFRVEDTVYFYQSGMAPESGKMRPGWLSITASIRDAIAQGFRCFDMLRGDESYKASLNAQPQPMVRMYISGHHARAKARRTVRQGMFLAKHIARKAWQSTWQAK